MKQLLVALFFSLILAPLGCEALVIDWSALSWTPGSLSNSFDVEPSHPGNDVTVTIGGNTNTLQPDATTGFLTPAITSSLEGGNSPGQPSLQLATSMIPPNQITVTISFSAQFWESMAFLSPCSISTREGTPT